MHTVIEGSADRLEAWLSFDRRIKASKRTPGGEITYHDGLSQTIQKYDPETDTITISHITDDPIGDVGPSVLDFPKAILKLFEESDGEMIQKITKYEGKDATIYKLSAFLGGMDMKIEMIVEMDRNILLFANQKDFDKDGAVKIEANAYFDYPEVGPDNIYDVGVPSTAKKVDE